MCTTRSEWISRHVGSCQRYSQEKIRGIGHFDRSIPFRVASTTARSIQPIKRESHGAASLPQAIRTPEHDGASLQVAYVLKHFNGENGVRTRKHACSLSSDLFSCLQKVGSARVFWSHGARQHKADISSLSAHSRRHNPCAANLSALRRVLCSFVLSAQPDVDAEADDHDDANRHRKPNQERLCRCNNTLTNERVCAKGTTSSSSLVQC